jgi:hypothetical protein
VTFSSHLLGAPRLAGHLDKGPTSYIRRVAVARVLANDPSRPRLNGSARTNGGHALYVSWAGKVLSQPKMERKRTRAATQLEMAQDRIR